MTVLLQKNVKPQTILSFYIHIDWSA